MFILRQMLVLFLLWVEVSNTELYLFPLCTKSVVDIPGDSFQSPIFTAFYLSLSVYYHFV